MPELTVVQLTVIGVAATLLVQLYRTAVDRMGGKKPTRVQVNMVVATASILLAMVFLSPTVQFSLDSNDPMAALNQVLTLAGAIVGFATIIYNLLLAKVYDKLGLRPGDE